MKTETFYINTKNIQAFKKSCVKMSIKLISTEVGVDSQSEVTVRYITPSCLFYLGQMFQLNCK